MGLRVARVTRGLQRRSSECVSDMAGCVVLESTLCFVCCTCATARFKVEKLMSTGQPRGSKVQTGSPFEYVQNRQIIYTQ